MRLSWFNVLNLILRRPPSGRLEGWAATPIRRDHRMQSQNFSVPAGNQMRPGALNELARNFGLTASLSITNFPA
jgi:hypothetical protein